MPFVNPFLVKAHATEQHPFNLKQFVQFSLSRAICSLLMPCNGFPLKSPRRPLFVSCRWCSSSANALAEARCGSTWSRQMNWVNCAADVAGFTSSSSSVVMVGWWANRLTMRLAICEILNNSLGFSTIRFLLRPRNYEFLLIRWSRSLSVLGGGGGLGVEQYPPN